MKPKFSFFMITHFTDSVASWISISQPPQGHSSQASATFLHSPHPFQLQKSLLLLLYHQSPLMANTSRQTISRNTRNANLPQQGREDSFRCVLSTWTIFLYPKTCGNERSESPKSQLFCQIQLQVGNELKKVLTWRQKLAKSSFLGKPSHIYQSHSTSRLVLHSAYLSSKNKP